MREYVRDYVEWIVVKLPFLNFVRVFVLLKPWSHHGFGFNKSLIKGYSFGRLADYMSFNDDIDESHDEILFLKK